MTKRPNRAAVLALLAALAFVLIAVGGVVYHTKARQLRELKLELAKSQKQVEEVRAKVEKMPELEMNYAMLSRQVSVLEPSLPTEAYIPTFLRQVQILAMDTNNRLTLIKPKPKRKLPVSSPAPERDVVADDAKSGQPGALQPTPEPVSPYDEIGIEVGFEGSYTSTLKFLEELKSFPKMIAVNDVSVKPSCAGSGGDPLLEVTFQLIAVMAKEK